MSGNFTTGTNGVDFVDLEFTITVNERRPDACRAGAFGRDINENGSVNFTVSFTDPGFDNPAQRQHAAEWRRGGRNIYLRYRLGRRPPHGVGRGVAATPGGVGVPSAGSFGENHIYADDGNYTVTVKIHDDDGGVAAQTLPSHGQTRTR